MRLFPLKSFMQKRSILICLLSFIIAAGITSCSTTKPPMYFTTLAKDTTLKGFITDSLETRIQKKDVLSITVSSLNKEMDEAFNLAAAQINESITASVKPPTGYAVDEKGNILIHMLGSVHVEGLTRNELKLKLQKDLLPYMKEPIIGVQYLNHKVTVLGYVERPQVISMAGEQIPLIDVLVSCGDLKDAAKRSDIMIIREKGNEKQVKHVNLEDNSIFSTPWYYVQPNDIVYVMPDKNRADKEEKKRTLQTTLALVASGISLLIIIINNFIK